MNVQRVAHGRRGEGPVHDVALRAAAADPP